MNLLNYVAKGSSPRSSSGITCPKRRWTQINMQAFPQLVMAYTFLLALWILGCSWTNIRI